MTCHDDLFADHGSEVYHLSTIFYRTDIIAVSEWIDMRLKCTLKGCNMYRMLHSLIDHSRLECIENHFYTIIECDDPYLETEGLYERDIWKISIVYGTRK
jgi:hypothetical protein